MPAIKVLLPILKLFPLDYLSPANMDLVKGDLVIVPFKNKEITGIVWEVNILSSKTKLKIITRKLNEEFRLSENLISLITKTTNYYLSGLGTIAKLVLPVEISEPPLKVKHQETSENFTLPPLSSDQNIALGTIRKCEKPTVLKGITGSGKTEIYFHLVDEFLRKGKQILIMLPEIALSQQIIKRFILRFGFEPIIWNSEISKSAKKMILRGIISGSVKIVIGARSSLFLPYKDLGLIIIDEEHDSSYKQQDGVMYNARDMAILRGNIDNIKVVLCSATPSLETVYNCEIGKYQLIELKNRFNKAILPIIKIIDMKQENLLAGKWLSLELITSIRDTLLKGEQILLFLNRRGYCPLVLCKSCGYRFTCPSCSSWLVLHKLPKKLDCHHCGFQEKISDKCPECNGENSLTPCGPGIERIEEEVARLFPNIRIALLSKDQVTTFKKGQELLHKMENNDIDILIGTQIVTKGYHFPNLTLVGVIDADLGLLGDDLRSAERTYQLLHQVGGRAGRAHKPGQVLLQTYHPDNLVLNTLKYNAEEKFLKYELHHRESFGMPPFTKMASIIVVDKNEQRALEQAKKLVCVAPKNNVKILGPARGIMAKIAGKYRYRILIIADKKFNLQKYLTLWLSPINISSSVQIKVDIDPQSFY